jgi:hypothetical protein
MFCFFCCSYATEVYLKVANKCAKKAHIIKGKEAQKAQRMKLKCSELKIETARTCSINKGTSGMELRKYGSKATALNEKKLE